MTPITILQLAANRWWTGSADPVIRLSAGLAARGHRVLLGVIPGDRFEAKAREAGIRLVNGVRLTTGAAPRVFCADILRLRGIVRTERIDVIHANHSHDHWLALLARGAREGLSVPVVRTFHNRRAVKNGALARIAYRWTAAAFAVSREIADRCLASGFRDDRVTFIPGSVDLERFASGDGRSIRDEMKLGEAPVIVTVARLATNRGHELLLQAFRILLGRVGDARLLLVGKGETRHRLEHLVAELGLGDRVIFTGYRDRDLPSLLAAADCFVLMAAGSDESCRAALEAMAAARPVVARRVGALPETVVPGETGLLIPDDDPQSVAATIADVLEDRTRGRAMGLAGRRRAEEVFTPERSVLAVEQVYRTLT